MVYLPIICHLYAYTLEEIVKILITSAILFVAQVATIVNRIARHILVYASAVRANKFANRTAIL